MNESPPQPSGNSAEHENNKKAEQIYREKVTELARTNTFQFFEDVGDFSDHLVEKYGKKGVRKCRLYNVLISNTYDEVPGLFLDFEGDESVATFVDSLVEKYKEDTK